MKNSFFKGERKNGQVVNAGDNSGEAGFAASIRGESLRFVAVVIALVAVAILVIVNFGQLWAMLGVLFDVATPLIIGAILAYLLNLIMGRLETVYFPKSTNAFVVKSRRVVCLVCALVIVVLVFGAVVWLVVVQMKDSMAALFDGIGTAMSALVELAQEFEIDKTILAMFGKDITQWETLLSEVIEKAGGVDKMLGSVVDFSGALTSGVVDAVVAFAFALYLLAGKERVLRGSRTFAYTVLPPVWYERACRAASIANECFSRFITGQCFEAIILGSLCALGMTIFNFPHALTIGVCVGLFSLVPLIGAWVGGIVGVLMILPYSVEQAVLFVVFLLVLQQFEGHVIYPRTVGGAVGVSSIWVLVAVFAGAALFGVAGILLGVPCVATASRLLEEHWDRPPEQEAQMMEADFEQGQ